MVSLYQPEKYKVFLGNGKSFGFCTIWNEAELVFNKSKKLQEKTAILGTLYSRQGVNIIWRLIRRLENFLSGETAGFTTLNLD